MTIGERQPLLGNDEQGTVTKQPYSSVSIVPVDESQSVPVTEEDEELRKVREGDEKMSKLIIPLGLGVFLAAMDQTVVASSYASIGSGLKQLQSTSWVATGYMLTLTSFQPLYGKLSDIFGRKPCLLFAYTVFGTGCLLCGGARNMKELIVSRALAGMGGAGMSTVVTILVSDIVPLRSRGTWQGILNLIFAAGSAVGAPLGGLLADGMGWRWSFYIQAPLAFLALTIVSLALHLPSRNQTTDLTSKLGRIDFLGAFTLICGVFSLLLGLDNGGNVSWSSSFTVISMGSAALFFTLFILTESCFATEPFAPTRVLAHPSLFAAYLCNLLSVGCAMDNVYYSSLFLQATFGTSAAKAGLGLVPAVITSVTGSLSSGLLMQRSGKYYWLTVGAYTAQVIGTALLVLATWSKSTHTGIGLVETGLAMQALGNGSGLTTTLIAIIANASPGDQAVAIAISYLFRSMGSVLGISVGGTLVQNTLRINLSSALSDRGVDIDDIIERARSSLSSLSSLPPAVERIVRASYAEAHLAGKGRNFVMRRR